MLLALASTAFLMGVTGGPHCLVMCAAPCAALTCGGVVAGKGHSQATSPTSRVVMFRRTAGFHMGRLAGYGAAGAAVALAMDRLAWLSQSSAALRPVWTLFHVLVLGWGLLMMLQARQPAWLEIAGRSVWARVRALALRPGGLFTIGMAWALLPCGLLYTALLTAALSGSVARGALCMVLFGVGSAIWLIAGPLAWQRARARMQHIVSSMATRLAGLVLFAMGGIALWMDVVHGQPAPWCLP